MKHIGKNSVFSKLEQFMLPKRVFFQLSGFGAYFNGKQCLQVGLSFLREQMEITDWLLSNRINILNIEVYGKRREKRKRDKITSET